MLLDAIILWAVGVAIKWIVYTVLIWIMIKLQGLDYNVAGLLGSTLAATLISFIPVIGPYLAYGLLLVCLWKCTRSDIVPDVLFTVTVSNAVMFVLNLWLLGAIMPDLRAPLPAGSMVRASEPASETSRPDRSPKPAAAKSEPTFQKAKPGYKGFVLRGITFMPPKSLAILDYETEIHTVAAGETFKVHAAKGTLPVRCQDITRSTVRLTIGEDDNIELTLF